MAIKKIATFIPNLHGGGAEKIVINLLKGMLKTNVSLDLVLINADGPYLSQIPDKVRVINLAAGRSLKSILPLSNYLRKHKPDAIISHLSEANLATVLAKKISRTESKVILVEHNTLSASKSKLIRARFFTPLMRKLYPYADTIVGVSQGVSQDLECQLNLSKGKVRTIYNPIVDFDLINKAKSSLDHPWFRKGSPPVFLAVGRLTEQKDFMNLIQAFALLRKQRHARLLILGEGEKRSELEELINKLGVREDVSLPGFVDNPYAYMSRANGYVLSSRWEGLPTVLIEAMACGCPVIATDCPSGPSEILEAGKYGSLVPVGDPRALSSAMSDLLESPLNRDILKQKILDFSIEQGTNKYLKLLGYA
ncbi:glycosyltransferase [Calothrix sp. PCC 6303]|uniref:glycosyltransferase n=1 Tax=Calothrix sp. PCC 6303 TaxID=1170562 RepID=UPI0002A028BC|nr:glycosyltransferase [Calothrix sp. PCC 6303]AFZ00160.1 glycosyl transferase group 1 [Calothrix sp. PCC 6303]